MIGGLFAALALAATACNDRVRDQRGVWNLYAIEAALEQGGNVAAGPTLPGGLPASDFLTQSSAGQRALKVQRAFADGQPAAFVSSEIWVNYYDQIWVQPIYAQGVTADPGTRIDPALLIDVGPESSFYSPFWRVSYAVVGDVPGYHSTKALLEGASQIVPAGMKTCPLRPLDVTAGGLVLPPPWDAWNGSITLPSFTEAQADLDNEGTIETFGVFDYGRNLFELEVEAHGAVVEARPMYLFAMSDGTLATDEPRVLGAGEVAIDAANGAPRPRFGGLWRVWKANLPATAGAFHGAEHPAARDAAMRGGGDPLDFEGRFALNASSCFADAAANAFPQGCVWLDSQQVLESQLGGGNLIPTEITQTGPLVLYGKQAVSPETL